MYRWKSWYRITVDSLASEFRTAKVKLLQCLQLHQTITYYQLLKRQIWVYTTNFSGYIVLSL